MTIFAEFAVPAGEFGPGPLLPAGAEVRAELERLVPSGSSVEYVWLVGDERGAAVEALPDRPGVTAARVVDELPGRTLVRLSWDGDDPVLRAVEATGAVLLAAEGDADRWRLRLRFPDREVLGEFYERCAAEAADVSLEQVNGSEPTGREDLFGLSETQRETVLAAFERGYFEVPRGTTLDALADHLGVSDQAVSERLRRGLEALLRATLDERGRAAGHRETSGGQATDDGEDEQ